MAISDYFSYDRFNCAEAAVYRLQERGALEIPACLVPAMSCFGGGMGCKLTCGAVTGAVAVLGLFTGKNAPEDPREPSKKALAEFLERWNQEFGDVTCAHLKSDQTDPKKQDALCCRYVETAAALAEEIILDAKTRKEIL